VGHSRGLGDALGAILPLDTNESSHPAEQAALASPGQLGMDVLALENRCTPCGDTEGSNPSLSATNYGGEAARFLGARVAHLQLRD
jgi:hypothetical protein